MSNKVFKLQPHLKLEEVLQIWIIDAFTIYASVDVLQKLRLKLAVQYFYILFQASCKERIFIDRLRDVCFVLDSSSNFPFAERRLMSAFDIQQYFHFDIPDQISIVAILQWINNSNNKIESTEI